MYDLRVEAANAIQMNDPGIECICVISVMRSSASPISYVAHVDDGDHRE